MMDNQQNDLSSGKEILETSKQSGFRVLESLNGRLSCVMPPANHVELFSNLQRFASIWMQKGRDESCEIMTQVDKALMDSLHKTAEIYQKDNIELRAKLAELENQKPVGKLYLYRAPMTGGTFSLPTLRPEFDLIAEQDTYARPVPAKLEESLFKIGDRVTKIKGSCWTGTIVGTYSTPLTPEGYAVESEAEKGSVQIYPAAALQAAPKQRETK